MATAQRLVTLITALALAATLSAGPVHAADPTDDAERIVGFAPLAAPGDGEGIPAEVTNVNSARGVATHPWTGDLYYSDSDTHRIRRIDRDGLVWTVAGDGSEGFAGDGGDAAEARLRSPEGLAFDGAGNLYIADTFNHRVRRIDTMGFISTVAGGGLGDHPLATNAIGDGGPATAANLGFPTDVAVTEDGRSLYIADSLNHRIRRVPMPTGPTPFIFTAAGSGPISDGIAAPGFGGDGDFAADARFHFPNNVAVSPDGRNLLIADAFNERVRRVYPSGVVETIAGDGDGTVAGEGRTDDGVLHRPAQGALAVEETLGVVTDVAFDHDLTPYFVTADAEEVFKIVDGRTFGVTGLGGGTFGTAANQQYTEPSALGFDAAGNLLVADEFQIVRVNDPDATRLTQADRSNIFGRPAEDEIKRLYRAAFGRIPDPAGHRYWLEQYQAVGDPATALLDIARGFVASGEFDAVYGDNPSDEEFVDVLYANVLGRAGDPEGRAFWLARLADGAERAEVLIAFANSPENVLGTRTALALNGQQMQVMRLYRAVFLRPPDRDGLFYWAGQAADGMTLETMAGLFLESPEAADLRAASGDAAVFVEALYSNVLGRLPDADGLAFWVGQLDSGRLTVNQVLVDFSESLENKRTTGTA